MSRAARALQEELHAVLAAQPAERRGRGPEHAKSLPPSPARARRTISRAVCIASSNVRPRTTTLISATSGGYRIAAADMRSRARRTPRSPGGRRAGCCSARDRASARSPRRRARRARRGRPPASAAETSARRRGSRRARGRRRPRSTPTSVTRGKSCPLAIICVPTSTSSSPAAKRRQQRRQRALAADRVAIDARRSARRETARAARASTRSVPKPACSRYGAAHLRHAFGTRHRVVAVVAARAPAVARACGRSATRCSSGHSNVSPHCRQNTAVAIAAAVQQHERLLAARRAASAIAAAQRRG